MQQISFGCYLRIGLFLLILASQERMIPAACAQISLPRLIPFRQQERVDPIPLTDQPTNSGRLPLPKLPWSARAEGDEPTLLDRFQQNSRSLFRDTGDSISHWSDRTSRSLRRSGEQTWGFLHSAFPKPFWLDEPPPPPPPLLPPPRSATDAWREPRIRF